MSDQGWKLPVNHNYGKNLRCPKCNYTLILKRGQTSPFYACPHCDYSCPSNKHDREEYANRQKNAQEVTDGA